MTSCKDIGEDKNNEFACENETIENIQVINYV